MDVGERNDDDCKKKEEKEDVQEKKSKTAQRIKKCRKRRKLDWSKWGSPSDNREIDENQNQIKSGEMGSGKKRKCRDKDTQRLDEFRKIESELGVEIRYLDSRDVCSGDKSLKFGT
jgi:ribosomal protein S8E